MMKVVLVATAVVLISLSLTWTTLAAPMQWSANSDLKNDLESIISQALMQQKDSHSTNLKDKEMVATFCKLMIQYLNYIKGFDHSGESLFGEGSELEYCQDFELPPEPRPEDKSATLANGYQIIFNLLKNSGIENIYKEYMKMLSHLG